MYYDGVLLNSERAGIECPRYAKRPKPPPVDHFGPQTANWIYNKNDYDRRDRDCRTPHTQKHVECRYDRDRYRPKNPSSNSIGDLFIVFATHGGLYFLVRRIIHEFSDNSIGCLRIPIVNDMLKHIDF